MNRRTGQITPMRLGQEARTKRLGEAAASQERIARQLDELANRPADQTQTLGDLEAMAQEAQALAERLARERLDVETLQRQERLFHRLLDAGRSLEMDEYSDERESSAPGQFERNDVEVLSPEDMGALRFQPPNGGGAPATLPGSTADGARVLRAAQSGGAPCRTAGHDPVRLTEWRWSVVVACVALLRPFGVHAQIDDPGVETRLLRAAASEESSGDLAGAEETLRRLLGERPTSTPGMFALERVLRARDRIGEILPFAERFAALAPNASGPRLLELRVYSELDDKSGLEDVAEDWMDSAGSFAEPYREISRVFARVFGPERALSVLQRGRIELGRPSLFAMEMGDLLSDLGRIEEAVLEWAAVIGSEGSQVSAVMRRVAEIEEDREILVLPLLEQLRRPPTTGARLRAGARIALEAGVFDEARALAETALEDLEGRPRRGFLTALARQVQEVFRHGE